MAPQREWRPPGSALPRVAELTVMMLIAATLASSMSNPAASSASVVRDLVIGRGVTSIAVAPEAAGTTAGDGGDLEDPLSSSSPQFLVFAGTTRGSILPFALRPSIAGGADGGGDWIYQLEVEECVALSDSTRPASRPCPVYSMAVFPEEGYGRVRLAAGGGDRLLTIWESDGPFLDERGGFGGWSVCASLGPHTGWVKDVLHSPSQRTLHSIGCSRVETWGRTNPSEDDRGGKWAHISTRSIESSAEGDACTLSSDLLCLSMGEGGILCAGGVDGRIHAWDTVGANGSALSPGRGRGSSPLWSIPAHNGRVNAMAQSWKAGILVSGGHDGAVRCHGISGGTQDCSVGHLKLFIENKSGEQVRITALALTSESKEGATVIVGTACGVVCRLEIQKHLNEGLPSWVWKEISRLELASAPTIHAISSLPCSKICGKETYVAVGHSNGLTILSC